MAESPEESNIVEEREEVMASLTGGDPIPTRRQAFFLKPSVNETVTGILFPSLSFLSPVFDPQKWPLKEVTFRGWRYPGLNWAKWVDLLLPRYKSVWEQAGIYDAILSTTHEIRRDDDLVCGIVERWCPETKSFVFVWGEATITLEDVMVLGGFSVIGEPVSLPLVTTELKEIEERLVVARKEIGKSKANKVLQNYWLKKFMGSGSDIEHEAFLVFWLSRFIFPKSHNVIRASTFPIAIHLARGMRIALAPSILAAIYKDLTLLKQALVDIGKDDDDVLTLILLSPFLLVQLWAWERFPQVQPAPNSLKEGDTRSARWHIVKRVRVRNMRSVLDSAGESFLWRPYTKAIHNWKFRKFYKECEGWIHVDSGLHGELLSFARCIRVSQLVVLGVVEQYLPHRVAMQFGMDQDLPANICQPDETSEIAWSNYCKPIGNKLYIPSRLFESDVTVGYLEWWKHSMLKLQKLPQVEAMVNAKKPRSDRRARTGSIKECGSVLLQELRSMNKEVNGGKPFSWSWPESYLTSTTSNGRLRHKHKCLDEIVQSVSDRPISGNGDNNLCNKAVEDCEQFLGKFHPLKAEPVNESGDDRMVEENMSFHFKAPMGGCGSGAKMQGADDAKATSLTKTTVSLNDNAGEDSPCKHEAITLDPEDRVTKLVEIFAKLKEAKLRRGLERKPTKDS